MVFSFAQTCKGSFKSMKYLKSKYVGSRYQHTRLVEVSVWDGPGLLLTCDHTHPALICGWVEGGHTSPPGSLGLWLSSIEQVKMFLPFSSSCLTFDRWLKLSELAFSPKIWGGGCYLLSRAVGWDRACVCKVRARYLLPATEATSIPGTVP